MRKLAIIFLYVLVAYPLLAQVPPPGGVPLDPVSWVVLGAAGVLGCKKYYDSKKEN